MYRARHAGQEYALKTLRADIPDRADAADAMRREAGLLACVDHPSVGRVYEVGERDGAPYLVMELIDGRNLAELLAAGPLPVGQVLRLGAELAGALAAAHRVGVVHRDVKPQNVVVGSDGRPKLVDFGLATHSRQKRLANESDKRGDETAGTFAYSAPEQTGMLARTVDGRADLYSLGVLLYECLTGARPFESPDVGELIRLHAVATPPEVSARRPDVPLELAAIVNRLLAKDPDDRYPNGESLAADLRALATGEPAAPTSARRPLVGRTAELARLRTRWDQVRRGSGAFLRLTGPAGIGKSHLADEFAERVRDGGYPVLTLACEPGSAPLGPVRAALDRYVSDLDRLPGPDRDAAFQRLHTASGAAASVLQLLSPALARVLKAPVLPDEDRQEQLGTAAATFLAGLARGEGGLLLYVDGADLVDEGTGRVLHELTESPPDHLLIVTTEPGTGAADEIRLAPLDEPEVAALAASQLGGTQVAPQLARQLGTRSGGNPFAVLEYVRAMLDAAVIRPSWGSWLLDERALDRLALPADVLDLVVARVEALPDTARRLLVAAAVIGRPFRPEFLAEVCRTDMPEAIAAVEEALAHGIIELHDGAYAEPAGSLDVSRPRPAQFAFLHQRAREAILADQPVAVLRALHQRVAQALDPGQLYEIACHYADGERDRDPQAMYRACLAAALKALAEQAPGRALEYLDLAEDAANRARIEPESGFHRAAGLARLRTGQFDAAQASLDAAYEAEPDPIRRADLLGVLAEVQHHNFASNKSVATARRALAETGHRVPGNPLVLALSTLVWFALGVIAGRSKRWFATAAGADRERYRVQAELFAIGAMGAGVGSRKLLFICLHLRSLYVVNRLGPGPEYVELQAALGALTFLTGLRVAGRRHVRKAYAAAHATGDPRLVAHVAWLESMDAITGVRTDTGARTRAVLHEYGPWLDLTEYLSGAGIVGATLIVRGYVDEAANWYDRAVSRLATAVMAPRIPVSMIGVQAAAARGQRDLAASRLAQMRDALAEEHDNPHQKVSMVIAATYAAVQSTEVGEDFEAALDEVRRLGLTPRQVWPIQREIWFNVARGRLARLHAATPESRPGCLAEAKRALRTVRRISRIPSMRGFSDALHADYLQATGKPEVALRKLSRASLIATTHDLPVLEVEVATVRARALQRLGQGAAATRQAEHAVHLATRLGLVERVRGLRLEFRVAASVESTGQATRVSRTSTAAGPAGRRLAALQQVSVAAATVLDPDQLARVALDETIRIFAAERAILFLTDPAGRLQPHIGRTAAGVDLEELTGYGSTFVEQVRESRQALVVASGEHGTALGSTSVVAYGLRSVMVSPLQLKGELLGAVYLDSRVAKGVFTDDDVDILTAITHQIAASMVTAQAAQLEATLQAAERRSELADTMRTSMAEVSQTLDPDEVESRLLATLVRAIGADLGLVLHEDGSHLANPIDLPDPLEPAVLKLLDTVEEPCVGADASLAGLLPDAQSWLALPLTSRARRVGLMLLVSAGAIRYDDGELRVAAALAEQGMVAYDNALLYRQVEQLAGTDPLTGLHNRRKFFKLSADLFDQAQQSERPLAAIMLDIDHFKRVNDTYGHAAGDEVIREVAARLRGVLRETDLLGRYGGEEFALILPGQAAGASAGLGERLRQQVAAAPVQTRSGPLEVTISVGTTQMQPGDRALDDALARADAALYRAKQAGRNRVVSEA